MPRKGVDSISKGVGWKGLIVKVPVHTDEETT